MSFHLMRPEWLLMLIPAIALALLLWRRRQRSGGWNAVIAPELLGYLVSDEASGRRRNFLPLILAGWVLATIAASGPSWEKIPQPVHQKQDALVVLLDLSYSMKAQDLPPSRMDRARQKLLDMLKLRREGQTAVIAYAGDAHVVTPLTDDTATIANLLPALHPDMMPLAGSAPVAAVEQGLQLLRSAGVSRGRLLLITDGVTEEELAEISERLDGSGSRLSVLGVGTDTGAPIPLPRGGFVRDRDGSIVMPALREAPLRALANAGRGQYRRMQVDNADLHALLAAPADSAGRDVSALSRTTDIWDDKGYLFLLPLLPLALALFRRGWLLMLLPLLLAHPQPASAQAWRDLWLTPDQQGKRALEDGEAAAAAELFEHPQWSGLAAYRAGDYAGAAERFARGDSADDWYNRGNALARAGELDAAISAYEKSLAREPDRTDAQQNLELVRQLKQQQDEQQQSTPQQQDEQQAQPESEDGNQQQNEQSGQQPREQDSPRRPADQSQPGDQHSEQPGQNPRREESAQGQPQDPQADDAAQQAPAGPEDSAQQAPEEGQQDSAAAARAQPPEQPGDAAETRAAQPGAESPQERERNQALEQWLRRVPDDPSGLLREKFRYESELRQRQGREEDNERFW